jgi:uncharacterized alpha-E superfamily protein
MLARNAESLYWIGRYGERADDTARILDVSVHQLLEDATIDVDAAARRLLDVLGIEPGTDGSPLDAFSLTEAVGHADGSPGSIVSSLTSARENARGAREVVSSEMWSASTRRDAEALRLLGRARSELEFLRPEELLDDLPALLLGLQETIRDVGEAVSLQFFHAAPWVAWTAPEVV